MLHIAKGLSNKVLYPFSLVEFTDAFSVKKAENLSKLSQGRAWKIDELRIKSSEDLQKLFYVLLKEKNLLNSDSQVYKKYQGENLFPHKILHVKLSIGRLMTVLGERKAVRDAYWRYLEEQYVEKKRKEYEALVEAKSGEAPTVEITQELLAEKWRDLKQGKDNLEYIERVLERKVQRESRKKHLDEKYKSYDVRGGLILCQENLRVLGARPDPRGQAVLPGGGPQDALQELEDAHPQEQKTPPRNAQRSPLPREQKALPQGTRPPRPEDSPRPQRVPMIKILIMNKKTKIYLSVLAFSALAIPTYLDHRYLRKAKGITKIAQIYLRDDLKKDSLARKRELKNQVESTREMQLLHTNKASYLKSVFRVPYALLLPSRLESLQKMVKLAQKYRVGVMNQDLEELSQFSEKEQQSLAFIDLDDQEYLEWHSSVPFVVINQKHLNWLEVDAETGVCRVGAGCTVAEVNERLKEHGYVIPLKEKKAESERLFSLLNRNEELVESVRHTYIGDLVDGVTFVDGTGKAVITRKRFGQDHSNLVIGNNATNGLIAEVQLRAVRQQDYVDDELHLKREHLSHLTVHYILQGMQRYLRQNDGECVNLQFALEYAQGSARVRSRCKHKHQLSQLLKANVNPFVAPEVFAGTQPSTPSQEELTKIYFQCEYRCLEKCVGNIQDFNQFEFLRELDLVADVGNGILEVRYNEKEHPRQSVQLLRALTSYVASNDGQFLKCTSQPLHELMRQESTPYELGLNRMDLDHSLKRVLDPHAVLLNKNYDNPDLQPTYE